VQGSNSDGIWTEQGVSLPIVLTPPWWRTTWFGASTAALVLVLLAGAYQLRMGQVRRGEKELRDVIETVPAMVWSAKPDGSVDFANRRWQEFTGRLDQSPGWDWQTVVHPDELDAYFSKWRASLATGQPFETEVRIRRAADGDYRWFTESAVPLRDAQGNIRKWYGVLADVEGRKRAEYLTRQVFESAPDGISVVGSDYRYQRVNPVYERTWRMPAERIVGMHVADLLGAFVFAETIRPNLDRCFAGEEVRYAQWFGDSRGRSYLAVSYSPLRPSSERVEAALVITRDLTDHALAAEALRAARPWASSRPRSPTRSTSRSPPRSPMRRPACAGWRLSRPTWRRSARSWAGSSRTANEPPRSSPGSAPSSSGRPCARIGWTSTKPLSTSVP
jgi:PAS domain S-box-containing protein